MRKVITEIGAKRLITVRDIRIEIEGNKITVLQLTDFPNLGVTKWISQYEYISNDIDGDIKSELDELDLLN